MPVAQTDAEDLALLRRHVENEVPEAVELLGNAYQHGHYGIAINMKKAVKIYKRGVELGSVEAMRRLGDMHDTGSGVKLDKKKASQLYRMAADRGMAKAQYSLANKHGESRQGLKKRWRFIAQLRRKVLLSRNTASARAI